MINSFVLIDRGDNEIWLSFSVAVIDNGNQQNTFGENIKLIELSVYYTG